MDKVTLRYGHSNLQLTKSETLVGIRPGIPGPQAAASAAARAGVKNTDKNLAEFQVLAVDDGGDAMESALEALRADVNVHAGTHVYHTSDDGVPFVPTGELYIRFSDEATTEDIDEQIDAHHLEIVQIHNAQTVTARVTALSANPVKTAAALQESGAIAVAEPDLATPGALYSFVMPSDGLLDRQWHLNNTGTNGGGTFGLSPGADARVVEAWQAAQSLGSPNVVVAVIDDGFDLGHPDLSGSGKVVAPWDFTRGNANPNPEFSHDYPYWAPGQGWVGDWHGTACAGVAIGNANGTGIVGAAPGSRFMPIRWGPSLANAQVTAWFRHVRDQGAAVVSCSWGAEADVFPLSTQIDDAIADCAQNGRGGKGCVICFAAGNKNKDIDLPAPTSPGVLPSLNGFATHPDVIAVAACTSRDQKAHYSNYGKAISVCAPSGGAGGRGIVTSDVRGTYFRHGQAWDSGYSPGAFNHHFTGTSSSAPLVAGICALILAIRPDLTAEQVKDLIQSTARKIGPSDGYDSGHSTEFGYGCIDAAAAVAQLLD